MATKVQRCILAVVSFLSTAVSAHAVDEIQVYNAEIAKVGQWTFQLHLNYAFIGRKEPDFPGGLIPNHALNGTGEWAYGITDWWEMGFYTPFAVDQDLTPYSNAAKIRQLFVVPNAADRGSSTVSISSSATRCRSSRRRNGIWRSGPSSAGGSTAMSSFGQNGGAVFAPAARFARILGDSFDIGIEYYTDLGPLQSFVPFNEQQHNIYAVVDFKIGRFDVNAGIGYGLTPGSDRLMAKMIIGTDLNEGEPANSLQAARSSQRSGILRSALLRP
jgi:hypothetical protein